MTFLPMGGRPAWMNHLLWQAIQLEAAPLDTAILIQIFLASEQLIAVSAPSEPPTMVETRIGRLRPTVDCEFYDLVLAVWLTARRARIAHQARQWVEARTAISEGAELLLLANIRRRPTADYVQTLSGRPTSHRSSRQRSAAR